MDITAKHSNLVWLIISIAMFGIITAITIPIYKHYTHKHYFKQVMKAVKPYVLAVSACYEEQGTLAGCNAGTNHIPEAITETDGVIANLSVSNGIINAKPVKQHGIANTITLTPTVVNNIVTWDTTNS